ncbi:hypothetical protein BC834DRAFT_873918 [Gloeopeniophorella convolvens]|nr:hypothetical protein BC834DRAFT_873918 [Gloeopeniophorella convolvens]
MELPASPSSLQFNAARKPGEPGLAEWAQKIRALQRQVDADEEEEHRKLEQEIAASRLARVRRSAGYGRASSVGPTPMASDLDTSPNPSHVDDAFEEPQSVASRQREQADALQKLVGKPSTSFLPQTSSTSPTPSTSEPMSFAAFIGGRASGPRLTKHAPQQDYSDPTLFEQHNINSSSAPHPVFGRGGIAIPGLASRGRRVVSPISDREPYLPTPAASMRDRSPISKPEAFAPHTEHAAKPRIEPPVVKEATREPRANASSAALKRYMQHVELVVTPQPDQPRLDLERPRNRTMSTPTGTLPARHATLPPPIKQSHSRPVSPRIVSPRSPTFDTRSSIPGHDKRPLLPSRTPVTSPSKSPVPTFVSPKQLAGAATPPAFGVKLPAYSTSTPSLPRPESFTPKATPVTPQHRTPSLHSPREKDPTPSISRLKGRGFVQSMVKASSALEAASSSSSIPEVGRSGLVKRQSLVTDRWKPESPLPSSPPAAAPLNFRKSWVPPAAAASASGPKQVTSRKSWTTTEPLKTEDAERPARALEPQHTGRSARAIEAQHTGRSARAVEPHHTGQPAKALEAQHTGRSVRKAPSVASLSTPSRPSAPTPSSPGGHGIGSSSTMFSYIKPMKTGDDPATGQSNSQSRSTTPHPHASSAIGPTSTRDVDELGHRTGVSTSGHGRRSGAAAFPVPMGKPLVHLTKGRPKPKKGARKPTDESEARVHASERPERSEEVSVARSPNQAATSRTNTLPPPAGTLTTSVHAAVTPSHLPPPLSPNLTPPTTQSGKAKPSAAERWPEQALIGVKPVASTVPIPQKKPSLVGLTGARALPGLSTLPPPSQPQKSAPTSPRSPRRTSRIPSTGSRALVMEVAQALQEAQNQGETEAMSPSPVSPVPLPPVQTELHAPPMEKRKSSFDKYSAFTMAALVEERTPATTPAQTLAKNNPPVLEAIVQVEALVRPETKQEGSDIVHVVALVKKDDNVIEIPSQDKPLPRVNVNELLLPPAKYQPSPDITSISVDVMSIAGATATGVKGNTSVFYDSEVLAIVHRFKTKSTGLVETKLWGWQGRRSQIDEREERKLKDMGRHYGTKLCSVHQGCEPLELVRALGGQLALRQGSRSHWTAENTTMHQVRSVHGNIFIDEYDLNISNLCSAFSYCLTLLGTSYVWHGKGSLPEERQAALKYAYSLTAEDTIPVELVEQESDDNEMFWMMLGDTQYASADYWKWRPNFISELPRVWRIDAVSTPHFASVPSFSGELNVDLSVYLIDCIWEVFVLVGTKARASRQDIALAVFLAKELASRNAAQRPFAPPVHVIILPSQLPSDLRLHFRDLDEEHVNGRAPPDHMNLLEVSEALADLGKVRWEKALLKDPTMLPLGIDPSMVP